MKLFLFSSLLLMTSAAHASWQCESWDYRLPVSAERTGETQEEAAKNSMDVCQSTSHWPQSCRILCCSGDNGPRKPKKSCIENWDPK